MVLVHHLLNGIETAEALVITFSVYIGSYLYPDNEFPGNHYLNARSNKFHPEYRVGALRNLIAVLVTMNGRVNVVP